MPVTIQGHTRASACLGIRGEQRGSGESERYTPKTPHGETGAIKVVSDFDLPIMESGDLGGVVGAFGIFGLHTCPSG